MTTKAPDILNAALGHMQDRAATYDKPEGERSMPATVAAFNALTGHNLTAEQGWLFMTVLKLNCHHCLERLNRVGNGLVKYLINDVKRFASERHTISLGSIL